MKVERQPAVHRKLRPNRAILVGLILQGTQVKLFFVLHTLTLLLRVPCFRQHFSMDKLKEIKKGGWHPADSVCAIYVPTYQTMISLVLTISTFQGEKGTFGIRNKVVRPRMSHTKASPLFLYYRH